MRMIPSSGYMYLCSPYSHPDPFVREQRYLATMREVAILLKDGMHVYSPIVHCHELAKIADLPRDADFWRPYNFKMLWAAETVGVLMLEGWDISVGIKDELSEAAKSHIHIMQIEPTP